MSDRDSVAEPSPPLDKHEFRRRDRWLVLAVLTPPAAVLANLTVNYALVPTACAQSSKLLLHVVTLVFTVITASSGLASWKFLRDFGDADVLWRERTRWVATLGVVLAIASIVVLIAMEIPNVMLGSCQ